MSLTLTGVSLTVEGVAHLDSIDLDFQTGRIYTVIGRTLAGKTTLLRALAGLSTLDSGRLELDGVDLQDVPPWKRDTAMVYQQFINYPHLSVMDNVCFPLKRAGLGAAEVRRRAEENLEKVGLTAFARRRPRQLSGGQQQRVALARALARRSRILLLDEPLVNLDYKLREQLREDLRRLFSGVGEAVVVYTTTEPTEALMLGDEVIVMHEGRILQVAAPAEVFERPLNTDVAQIINDPPMNLFDGSVAGEWISFGGLAEIHRPAHLAGLPDGSYRFGLRATDIRPSHHSPVSGEVTFVEISGSETFVHLSVGDAALVMRAEGIHDLAIGDPERIELCAERMFVFGPDGRLRVAPDSNERG